MQTKVEGLILNKILLKEKDLLCKLLLRNGKKISVLFYGGKSGGAKRKNTVLELAHLIKVELQYKRHHAGGDEIYAAKEWTLSWAPKNIRKSYSAFYLMNFYLEVAAKMATDAHLHADDAENSDEEGAFRVLSNGVFHLDQDLGLKKADLGRHMWFFLAKLSYEMGVAPNVESCVFCENPLLSGQPSELSLAQGGLICASCLAQNGENPRHFAGNQELIPKLRGAFRLKYSENGQISAPSKEENHQLFSYLCYQFHLRENDFKTLNLLVL